MIKWSPKQLTKEFLEIYSSDPVKEYTFRAFIDATNQSLSITLRNNYDEHLRSFVLSDVQSEVATNQMAVYGG